MFEHKIIIITIFLGVLLLAWAIVKFYVSKTNFVRDPGKVSPCLNLKGKIALEPGVNVYLVAVENSEIFITVNNRKFGSARAEVLSKHRDFRAGDANA